MRKYFLWCVCCMSLTWVCFVGLADIAHTAYDEDYMFDSLRSSAEEHLVESSLLDTRAQEMLLANAAAVWNLTIPFLSKAAAYVPSFVLVLLFPAYLDFKEASEDELSLVLQSNKSLENHILYSKNGDSTNIFQMAKLAFSGSEKHPDPKQFPIFVSAHRDWKENIYDTAFRDDDSEQYQNPSARRVLKEMAEKEYNKLLNDFSKFTNAVADHNAGFSARQVKIHADLNRLLRLYSLAYYAFLKKIDNLDYKIHANELNGVMLSTELVRKAFALAYRDKYERYPRLGVNHIIVGVGLLPSNQQNYMQLDYQQHQSTLSQQHLLYWTSEILDEQEMSSDAHDLSLQDNLSMKWFKRLIGSHRYISEAEREIQKLDDHAYIRWKLLGDDGSIFTIDEHLPYYQHFLDQHRKLSMKLLSQMKAVAQNENMAAEFKVSVLQSTYRIIQQLVDVSLNLQKIILETMVVLQSQPF